MRRVLHWYFAYGSNMQTATLRGRRGIAYARAIPVRATGWRICFDKPSLFPTGHSFANLVADAGGETLGVAYEVHEDELGHIDRTEGVHLGNYRRVEIEVVPLAVPHERWIAHTLVSDACDPSLRPSLRYMGCIVEGALEHGLPAEYVEWLRGVEAIEESEEARRLRPLLDDYMKRRERGG
jgi:hypothetical protein